ncbi:MULTISPECIES: hypothetical protein [unclassified Pseudomonas]|uniref:hypothetical protein n=1 Tax=unclassified Pseudomonas TaxID=196821 RepID=UPI0015A37988|nr:MULTISPECIES: hypothetical protein [unclassified Pseudomonas]NWC92611.1 hypothetical protein [Pseudomonas sp. IPO3779]NWD15608.1 hypothetical protein [Pseudomonas sp. IPO3778]
MFQIDNSTAVSAIPAPTPAGPPGYFTDGNPATGASATILTAEFMNTLMMETLNVLSSAGITPEKGQYNQLALAISKIAGSNSSWGSIGNKPTTIFGYGITDAYTNSQVDAYLENKADKATTLAGYGITDAYTASQVDAYLEKKADEATTLAGYGISDTYTATQINTALATKLDTSGGQIDGFVVINTAGQSVSTAGVRITNPTVGAGAVSGIKFETTVTATSLVHVGGTSGVAVRDASGNYAKVDAGDVTSNGSLCHSAATFLKPASGIWVQLSGSSPVVPAGGTWAYYVTNYNGSGAALGAAAGVVAGGMAVGSSNSQGFAWRIQ